MQGRISPNADSDVIIAKRTRTLVLTWETMLKILLLRIMLTEVRRLFNKCSEFTYSTGNLSKNVQNVGNLHSFEGGRANAAAIILGQIMNALALIHTHAATEARTAEATATGCIVARIELALGRHRKKRASIHGMCWRLTEYVVAQLMRCISSQSYNFL